MWYTFNLAAANCAIPLLLSVASFKILSCAHFRDQKRDEIVFYLGTAFAVQPVLFLGKDIPKRKFVEKISYEMLGNTKHSMIQEKDNQQ